MMKFLRRLLAAPILALGLWGCGHNSPVSYPAPLNAELAHFPPQAAGFSRGSALAYAPGTDDVSVAYNRLTADEEIVATLYQFPKGGRYASTLAEQFRQEKASIERAYAGAEKLAEEALTLRRNGQEFPAMKAAYRYAMTFMQQRHEVYSEVIVWSVDAERYAKLRSTTRLAQRAVASARNRELIDAVDWTVRPRP